MRDAAREAAGFIAKRSRQDLAADRQLTLALVKEVEIIGEAAGRISDDVRVAVPAIPWVDVIGMRNRLVHVYFDIDLDRLWDTVQQDLPPLAEELERTLAGLDSSSPPDASQR
jgi:uncharacterized protein with HEPN domain